MSFEVKSAVELLSNSGDLVIFLFHGVVERSDYGVRNYTRKHLLAAQFQSLIEELARAGEPLSMDQVLKGCQSGSVFPRGAFAITFDDGFENNLSVARPILDAHKVPAMVYVTSGFIEMNGMSWIDRIEWAFEHTPSGQLVLPWSAAPVIFHDGDSKIKILSQIRTEVKSRRDINPETIVNEVFRQLRLDPVQSSDDPLDKKMTWRQVREWSGSRFSVGGHTHTHPILSFLAPDQLSRELDTSLELLRDRAGIVTHHYSYPEGLAHCYSPEVIAALKARSITCCPTAIEGINTPGSDPFHLRRVAIT